MLPDVRIWIATILAVCLFGCNESKGQCMPPFTDEQLQLIARQYVKEKYGANFFSTYSVDLIVTRRESCKYDVMIRYAPARPGGGFMLRIDSMGVVYDEVSGV